MISRETYRLVMAKSCGVCECCGGALDQYGTPQLAHRIAKTETNYKKYGTFFVEHQKNLAPTCSLSCNQSMNIGNNPGEVLKLLMDILIHEVNFFGGKNG